MGRDQRFMLNTIWVLIGVLLAIDVFQNCMLGVDCVRVQDGVLSSWLIGFVQWIFYSGPAFILFAWLVVTIFFAVKSKITD